MRNRIKKIICALLIFTCLIPIGVTGTVNAATETRIAKIVTFSCGLQVKLKAVFDDSCRVSSYDYEEVRRTSSISDYNVSMDESDNSVTYDILVLAGDDAYEKSYTVTCDSDGHAKFHLNYDIKF
jgi:hypothetical protein